MFRVLSTYRTLTFPDFGPSGSPSLRSSLLIFADFFFPMLLCCNFFYAVIVYNYFLFVIILYPFLLYDDCVCGRICNNWSSNFTTQYLVFNDEDFLTFVFFHISYYIVHVMHNGGIQFQCQVKNKDVTTQIGFDSIINATVK